MLFPKALCGAVKVPSQAVRLLCLLGEETSVVAEHRNKIHYGKAAPYGTHVVCVSQSR